MNKFISGFTEEDFNSLLETTSCLRKSLGWYIPYGSSDNKEIEGYSFLGNIINDYWYYESSYGCIGTFYFLKGSTLDELNHTKEIISSNKNQPGMLGCSNMTSDKWNELIKKLKEVNELLQNEDRFKKLTNIL